MQTLWTNNIVQKDNETSVWNNELTKSKTLFNVDGTEIENF